MASARRTAQTSVKSSTKNQPDILSPEINDDLDEIIKQTEELKDYLAALKIEVCQKRETKSEKAIKNRAHELMKGVKGADEAKYIREEKEKFDRMSETEKEKYITDHGPKPRPKKTTATPAAKKK